MILIEMDEYSSQDDESSKEEEKEDIEGSYPCEGELMMIRRTLNNHPTVNHETQRENIFHTRCKVLENICSLIVNSGSCCNCCSTRMVEKLNIQLVPHPKPYKIQWINEDGKLIVDKRVKVSLSVGNYKDEILCDVVPMEACHVLLGRPCQFDKKVMHNGFTNEITFTHKEKKFVLYRLTPSQVVKDQVQMKQKRENEKKIEKPEKDLILPVDRNAGNCLVKGSSCAPLLTSVPLRDLPQEPAKKQSGAVAADRTPTLKSAMVSPNTKRTRTVQILSHSQLYNSQA